MRFCTYCKKPFDKCQCDDKDYGTDTYDYSPNELANLVIDNKISSEELDNNSNNQ